MEDEELSFLINMVGADQRKDDKAVVMNLKLKKAIDDMNEQVRINLTYDLCLFARREFDRRTLKMIEKKKRNVPFVRLFASVATCKEFLHSCADDGLITNDVSDVMMVNCVKLSRRRSCMIDFLRRMHFYLIVHSENAISDFDMRSFKKYVQCGYHIDCNNLKSLISEMKRL